jgi:ribonuclease HI
MVKAQAGGLYNDFLNDGQRQADQGNTRTPATEEELQGQRKPEYDQWLSASKHHKDKLCCDLSPSRPELDMHPTGSCYIAHLKAEFLNSTGKVAAAPPTETANDAGLEEPPEDGTPPGAPDWLPNNVLDCNCVFDEGGKFIGALTDQRLAYLYRNFSMPCEGCHDDRPKGQTLFAEEVVALLQRPNPNRGCPIPVSVWDAVHQVLGSQGIVEVYSDPLHTHHQSKAHMSDNIRDKLFGSLGSPHSAKWTGISLGRPPNKDAALAAAVKHAAYSAMWEDAPVLSLLLLPAPSRQRGFAAQLKRLGQRVRITTVCELPKGLDCLAPSSWRSHPMASKPTTGRLTLVAIQNKAARMVYGDWQVHVQAALACNRVRPTVPPSTDPIYPTCKPKAQFSTLPSRANPSPPLDVDIPTVKGLALSPAAAHRFSCQGRLMAYSDGSCIKMGKRQVIGAGVYAPSASEASILINPGGVGVSNTINRAELAGILIALAQGFTTIATDSLSSLFQIRRAVHDPMSLRLHQHRRLLAAISDRIRQAPTPVHLLKVKAHSGVIGNERADALARQAAHLGDLCPTGLTPEPNPFEGRTWLRAGKHILANVSSAVKDAMMTHRLGAANQESLYFTSWKAAAEAAVPESLELIMSDKVPPAQRKLALQYRTGSMWNQKLAFRFGRARTANCPCCSKPDSATHILSGPCAPQHSLMVTSRHNGAVGIVAKALRWQQRR